jgi:nucleoside-diphosphate-sugar epimerase
MSDDKRTCVVTGANGYVGSRIVGHLRRKDWRVFEMRHDVTTVDPDHGERIPFSLEKGSAPRDFRGIDTLIHCAYDFRPTGWREIVAVNVDGSRRLLETAREAGVRTIVLISTLSAFDGCRSLYGKAKLAIEEIAARFGATRVRPGLVWGDQPGGTFGALESVVSVTPIVPLVGSGRYRQYLSHEEDLCRAIRILCSHPRAGSLEPITAAAERPLTLREILETLAERRAKKVSFIPVPESWILAALRGVEMAGLRMAFRSDGLISLMNQNPCPDFGPTREIQATFREFGSGT